MYQKNEKIFFSAFLFILLNVTDDLLR